MIKPKSGYKIAKLLYQTHIQIPEKWDVVIGENLFKLSSGVSPSEIIFADDGNCLFVQVDDMNTSKNKNEIVTSKLKFNNNENQKITVSETERIVFPKRGAAILGNKVRKLAKKSTVDPNIMMLDCNDSIIPNFLYYFLSYLKLSNLMESAGIPQLNNKDLYPRNFLRPSVPEQKKISTILSNVDNLISSYNTIIETTKKLKTGLMQTLLIKGIGHKKFKKVKWFFGKESEIPSDWDYPKFSEVIKVNPPTKIEETTVPYIPMDAVDISKPHFNYFEERKLSDFSSLPKFQENDVLFASITPSTENGKTCIIENFSRKGMGSSELTVLRPTDKVIPKYLYYYVKNHRIRQFTISQMMGTTGRQRVPDYVFKKDLNFELPSLSEQQKIVTILNTVDDKISELESKKLYHETLKIGLMQKLLTGQMSVTA